jgi:hypothetical protein
MYIYSSQYFLQLFMINPVESFLVMKNRYKFILFNLYSPFCNRSQLEECTSCIFSFPEAHLHDSLQDVSQLLV